MNLCIQMNKEQFFLVNGASSEICEYASER